MSNIIKMIRSRRIIRAGHVARMTENINTCRVLVGRAEGKNHEEDKDVGGNIILKWILER
jgi:hypothetical protein